MNTTTAILARIYGYWNVWLIGAGPALHMTPELFEHYRRFVPTIVVKDHPQFQASVLNQSGLLPIDLVPSGEP